MTQSRTGRGTMGLRRLLLAAAAASLTTPALGADILETVGFASCGANSAASVSVQKVDIRYDAANKTVTFDVAGSSSRVQNVTASLNVTAYGQNIYSNSFNPCSPATFVSQLCPVPAGRFAAKGTQAIPKEYADLVPAIAFQIPDIAAMATLQLKSLDTGANVACIRSQVSNGKTASVPAVSYVAAGVAGAALVLTGVSAVAAGISGAASGGFAAAGAAGGGATTGGGMGTISPSFVEVVGWFQGMAMNGMLSVNYPQVYRSFAKNFAFSTGIIPWTQLQVSIDNFRASTGGDLSKDSVEVLRNSTLVFPGGSSMAPAAANATGVKVRRAFERLVLLSGRQITTSVNETEGDNNNGAAAGDSAGDGNAIRQTVSGIQAYVEQLAVPQANTFMTVLLVVSIVIAAIAVGILLVKVILELWALFGSFPKALAGFRKHYWGSIARAITSLILLLYGIWVLYCVFQFTHGDSWAAKALAGVSLALFTGILLFFSWKIWSTARKLRRNEGDASGLYEEKDIWVKYSLFYESYKKQYWWIFVPTIVYMFAKGATLAAVDGHGMAQTIAQLAIEAVMLGLLLWSRPFERRSGNVINVVIQVVRVLSVVCILVFVEEFGIAQTTQTVAGVVLIAVQSALTGVLAILIAWNAIILCCKENPHRKRRKEMEKLQRDYDNLTPLDARNSLLINRTKTGLSDTSTTTYSIPPPMPPNESALRAAEKTGLGNRPTSQDQYASAASVTAANGAVVGATSPSGATTVALLARKHSIASSTSGSIPLYRPLTPNGMGGGGVGGQLYQQQHRRDPSRENLVAGAAPLGQMDVDGGLMRQPTIPNLGPGPAQGYGFGAPAAGGASNGGYGAAQARYAPVGNGYGMQQQQQQQQQQQYGGYGAWRGPPPRGGY